MTRKERKAPEQLHEPEWVTSMHEHYSRTGSYRTEDLDRVLGDPRKQVSGETATDLVACRPSEKRNN